MDDLISRQAAIEAVLDRIDVEKHGRNAKPEEIQWTLEKLPSAQPEIIYCKKCEHWTRTYGDEQWGLGDCDVFDKHLVRCNGYCSWAERRTDENNNE